MSNFETLNSGEWSEVYALFKAISDKELKGCNYNLDLIDNEFCSIISVEKKQQETGYNLSYRINKEKVEIYKCNIKQKEISLESFRSMADYLLKEIKSNEERTFGIPVVKRFLEELLNPNLKASSQEKKDIIITVNEPITKTNQTYGFSVKSNLSKATSTLLNASKATNFTYIVNDNINDTTTKAKKLLSKIKSISFSYMDSDIFNNNLQVIDTQFPEIISLILLYYYQKKGTSLTDLIRLIQRENPLNLKDLDVYRVKIGDFLLSIALGMMPNRKWNRLYNADGGMLVIKENGDIASFYIFKQKLLEELKEYLIRKTYLDTPSTSRHAFGYLYEVERNGKVIKELKLNLQIRIHAS